MSADLFPPTIAPAPAPLPDHDGQAAGLAVWLRLVLTPGIGPVTVRRLLQRFGTPEALFDAPPAALRDTTTPALSLALSSMPPNLAEQLEQTQRWLEHPRPAGQRRLLTILDPDYPPCLASLHDAPALLYLEGDITRLGRPGVAVVGSRKCSAQGREHARHFAAGLSQAGVPVISGLALGIDGIAHQAALEGTGGTIAVVATGLDTVYPRSHRELAHRIAQSGLMLSEFPLGTATQPIQFPRRNRLIAGLSRGVLVIEAALPSGTLITAQFAADQGRDVFALPGPITSPLSRGCHHLIKQGARLVESVEEILDELALPACPRPAAPASATVPATAPDAPPDPLCTLLAAAALTLDELSSRSGLGVPALQARLLELELAGRVLRLPGGLYQALHRA